MKVTRRKKQEMVPLMELIKRRMLEIKTQVNQVQVAVNEKSIKCLELLGFSVKRIWRMKAT